MIVSTFGGLRDTSGLSFGRRVVILETVAKYRSCVVMLDLECDDLVKEMFNTFFSVARFVIYCCTFFCCRYIIFISAKTSVNNYILEYYLCSDEHPESVLASMQTIMVVLLQESEDIQEDLLFSILSVLGRNKKVSILSLLWHLLLVIFPLVALYFTKSFFIMLLFKLTY